MARRWPQQSSLDEAEADARDETCSDWTKNSMAKMKILVVDDDSLVRTSIRAYLRELDYEVTEAGSLNAAKDAFRAFRPDAAIMDYCLPDGAVLDVLPQLKAHYPWVPLILLTGHGTIELAVRALKEPAEQLLTKPVHISTDAVVLERALANQRNVQKKYADRAS